jgi:phage N-6-adenine-methyltransferase
MSSVDFVSKEFGGFDLDTCATAENAKCTKFLDIAASGLDQHWQAKNWCNPPYSELKKWVTKARREQLRGNLTVMLVPARTDTAIFHDSIYNQPSVEIRFVRGRLKFRGSETSAPFPSMLLIFNPIGK